MATKTKVKETSILHVSKEEDSLPKLLRRNFLRYGTRRVAMRKKDFGIWQNYTWNDVYNHIKHTSIGLISLGLQQGDKVALIGNNDPQLYWALFAIQSAGAIPVCLYVDATSTELKYYITHSEAKFIIAEDQEQTDKLVAIWEECPALQKLIYWDPKGLWFYEEPYLMTWEKLEESGQEHDKENPKRFEKNIDATSEDDYAFFCYTSGTTGVPKCTMVTYKNIIHAGKSFRVVNPLFDTDDYLSYISPAWIGEYLLGLTPFADAGMIVNFPEEPETIRQDLRDLGPKFVFFGPRLWEDIASEIRVTIEDSSWLKKLSFNLCMRIGYRIASYQENHQPVPLLWKFLFKLAYLLVLRAVQDRIGLKNCRFCATAGMSAAPDLIKFFAAIGVPMVNILGASECGLIAVASPDDMKYESVGKLLPGNNEIRFQEDGEICVRGSSLFAGYWKNQEEYHKKVKNGWFYTGDAGWMDEDGDVIYWDRIEELVSLKDGSKFAPQFAETRLRFSTYVKDAIVIGGENREYVTAILNMDFRTVGKWAESINMPYTTYTDLSQKAEVLELIKKDVERVNKLLPATAEVKKFVNLHKEFDPDEAELTRTRKLKRAVVDSKYASIIDGMYDDKTALDVELPVIYQDGRTGIVKTVLKVVTTTEN